MSNSEISGWRSFGFALIFVASAILMSSIAAKGFYPIDYGVWHGDWKLFRGYVASGVARQFVGLSKFPPGYLLNSLLSGEEHQNLVLTNMAALLLPVLCLGLLRSWGLAIAAGSVYLVALVFSPLPAFYISSGALEIQSGVVGGIFIAALSMVAFPDRHTQPKVLLALLTLSGLMLPLYKDTNAIVVGVGFLLVAATRAFASRGLSFSPPSRQSLCLVLWFGALPVILGILLSIGYNVLKYGVPWPVAYLAEAKATAPALSKSLEFLLGSLFSPNGGIVVFWFLPFTLVIVGWRMLGLAPRNSVTWLGATTVLFTCLGLARWWAPFGWDSWGNRLMIQPMLALMVSMFMSLARCPFQYPSGSRLLSAPLLILPILFWSGYYVLVPHLSSRFHEVVGASLNPGPACREMYRVLPVETSRIGLEFWKSETYYRCARERMLHVPSPNIP